jgi:acyl-coenzyme A synthetase/AMP-(fatty) acid ligase
MRWIRRPTRENGLATGANDNLLDPIAGEVIRQPRLPEEIRARYDTSSLECIVHAAAPCPVPVKQAMIDWLRPVITEYYGATEANGFIFCDSARWQAGPAPSARQSSANCPRSVDFVDELPRYPTGKLYKRLLRDRYWAGHLTRIV